MGYTGTQIAREIEVKFKVKRSRSAVVGWLHRQGATQGEKEPSKAAIKRASAVKRGAEANRIRERIKARAKATTKTPPKPRPSAVVESPNARDWRTRGPRECTWLIEGHVACCNPVIGQETTLRKSMCEGHYKLSVDWGRFKPIGPKKQEFYAVANTFRERTDHGVEARRQEVGKWG